MDTIILSNEVGCVEDEMSVTFHSPLLLGYEDNDFCYSVIFQAKSFKAESIIYNLSSLSDPSAYFKKIAEQRQGWDNREDWASLEEDLLFSACFDNQENNINLQAKLVSRDHVGASWDASVNVTISFEQCAQLGTDLYAFLRME